MSPAASRCPIRSLSPERSYTLELGASWIRGSATAELTVFRIGIDDLLERSFGTFQGQSTFGPDLLPVLTIQNIGSATIDGVEGGPVRRTPRPRAVGPCGFVDPGRCGGCARRDARGGAAQPRAPGDAVVSPALAVVPRRAVGLDRVLRQGGGRPGPARLPRHGSTAASKREGRPRTMSIPFGEARPGGIDCASPPGSRTCSTSCIAFTARASTPPAGTSSCGWTCGVDRPRLTRER